MPTQYSMISILQVKIMSFFHQRFDPTTRVKIGYGALNLLQKKIQWSLWTTYGRLGTFSSIHLPSHHKPQCNYYSK